MLCFFSMRLAFAYDIEKDARNYQVGVRSLNNKRPTKRQAQYMERYGKVFTGEYLREFILDCIRTEGIGVEEIRTQAEHEWRSIEERCLQSMERVFRFPIPHQGLTVYLTTDERCSYSIGEGYFFLSIQGRKPKNTIIMHELCHFWTAWRFGDWVASGRLSALQYNDIKESLTVLLNSEFLDLMEGDMDLGYPQHQELRAIIQQAWTQTKDIDRVFALAAEHRLLQEL